MKFPSPISRCLFVALAGVVPWLSTGCSKGGKKESPEEVTSQLIKAIPLETLMFGVMRFDSAGYLRALKSKSPEAGALTSIAGSTSPQATAAKEIIEAIQRSPLFPTAEKQGEGLISAVGFIGGSEQDIQLGIFGRGSHLDTHAKGLTSELAAKGIAMSDEPSLLAEGVTVAASIIVPKNESPQGTSSGDTASSPSTPQKLFLLANDSHIALVNSATLARRLFAPDPAAQHAPLLDNAVVKPFMEERLRDPDGIVYGFIDTQKLSSLAKEAKDAAAVEAIRFDRAYRETPEDRIAFILKDGSDATFAQYFKTSSQGPLFANAPSPAVLSLGIAESIIAALREKAAAAPAASAAFIEPEDAQFILSSISSLNVTFDFDAGSSPFPELLISAKASDTASLSARLSQIVKGALAKTPYKDLPWEKKTIEGVETQVVLSPMGIGLFLGATKDHVLIASSSSALTRGAKVSGGTGSLLAALPKSVAETIDKERSPLAYHLDFPRLSSMLKGLGPLLGAAAGGQATIPPEVFSNLEALGVLTGTVSVSGNVVEIRQTYQRG